MSTRKPLWHCQSPFVSLLQGSMADCAVLNLVYLVCNRNKYTVNRNGDRRNCDGARTNCVTHLLMIGACL